MGRFRRFARWMDRPGRFGWVWYGPDGDPRGWAPFGWLAEWLKSRDEYAHDISPCGAGWADDTGPVATL